MNDERIKYMTERFLSWKLPESFNPDNGITAKRPNYAPNVKWEPTGTNLLDYAQAETMVRHMLEGLPVVCGSCVLQTWALDISLMQQTVLLAAVRGPDGVPKYGPTKMLLRWYRRCTLLSAMDGAVLETPYAAGGGSFTGPSYQLTDAFPPHSQDHDWRSRMDVIVGDYLRELDAIPHHFQLHFLHAAEILGYKHGDAVKRAWWRSTYERLVHDMHLWPETEEQLDRRLGDCREQWLERNDPATVD